MDFLKEQSLTASRNIPGVQASKGEPGISKALNKLWMKMQYLEQTCNTEKQICSKESQTSFNKMDPELTVTEVQCKLLELQLQYVRSILQKKSNSACDKLVDSKLENKNGEKSELAGLSEDYLDTIPTKLESSHKNTQTVKINSPERTFNEVSKIIQIKEITELPVKSDETTSDNSEVKADSKFIETQCAKAEKKLSADCKSSVFASRRTCAQSHYHMKLSDVPFIVGTSASASHSVIANVQNIIGMMRTHNKGLCSTSSRLHRTIPRRNFQRTRSDPELSTKQDMKNMLKNLAEELTQLTIKQENLKQKLDAVQHSETSDKIYQEYLDISKLMETKAKEIADFHGILRLETGPKPTKRRHRSLSESSCQQNYKSKLILKPKERHNVSKNYPIEKKITVSSKWTDGSGRCKLMQSLKQLKVHLQEEDICWT